VAVSHSSHVFESEFHRKAQSFLYYLLHHFFPTTILYISPTLKHQTSEALSTTDMKVNISLLLLALSAATNALPHPTDAQSQSRDVLARLDSRNPKTDFSPSEELWKRKGGGGGGGRGGGGGGGKGGGSGGSSPGGKGAGSSSSSTGGRTTTGSGVTPSYGRGYYGGGASVPYTAGARSASGISPILFLSAGALAVFPALWLYGVYSYPYTHPYSFYNATVAANQTKPVNCLCQEYSECGCDENGDNSQLDQLVGNGSYDALNQSVITVADINGTSTILINGTLPNGTTAAGGTDSPNIAASTIKLSGYWLMVALVGCTVFLT
jgi:hypothetical protein